MNCFLRPIRDLAIVALLGCGAAVNALAAEEEIGIWGIFSTDGAFGSAETPSRWRYAFDAQLRYFDIGSGINQYQLRPGIGYAVSDNMSVMAGYLYGNASNGSGRTVIEHRLWQQLGWNAVRWSHGTLSMRARLEQQSLSSGDDLGWRLRYMLKYARPLGSAQNTEFTVSVEPFFALRDTDWGADSGLTQNRTAIGLGWKLSPTFAIESGYLNQYVFVDDAEDRINHIAVVNFKVKF